ncbi:ABC transporter [Microbacterium amylolyticum]|uniref:ABC transporter n=1 Tax=Microbacterium amylolyticum TaxID=936337 RepID=A0ABS4ZI82_9MICO|nr:ABC transporter [Microbacterium amylolyticum]MBP2436972.1 hypothetical protein [Microbacterium amylolyticum]
MTRTTRFSLVAAPLALGFVLAGCAPTTGEPAPPAPSATEAASDAQGPADEDDHGLIPGAEEVAEPQSQLVSVAADGSVGLLDLLTGEETELGTVGTPSDIASDGRYAFVTTKDGATVIDGGRWSWDHGDHFHYYRATPALAGTIPGSGPVHVTGSPLSTAGGTGLFFDGSGEAVLIDNSALSDGEITETLRIDTGAESGVVAPIGDGAIVATHGGALADTAQFFGADGEPVDGASAACIAPSGAITTRVGTVVGCEDGALIAVTNGDGIDISMVEYPDGATRTESFSGRKNRPTVSGVDGDGGFWLLSTRSRAWQHVDTDQDLVIATTADNADGHVVALDTDGRIIVFSEDGEQLAETEPIVADSLVDGAHVDLVVDQQRAYLSAPSEGVVYEIDYADGARIARELTPSVSPDFATELGR